MAQDGQGAAAGATLLGAAAAAVPHVACLKRFQSGERRKGALFVAAVFFWLWHLLGVTLLSVTTAVSKGC